MKGFQGDWRAGGLESGQARPKCGYLNRLEVCTPHQRTARNGYLICSWDGNEQDEEKSLTKQSPKPPLRVYTYVLQGVTLGIRNHEFCLLGAL